MLLGVLPSARHAQREHRSGAHHRGSRGEAWKRAVALGAGATVGTGRRMNARFAGRCRCGAAVCRGDAIVYDRGARGVVQCPICRDARAEGSLADAFDRAYEDQCSATCGLGGERDGGG